MSALSFPEFQAGGVVAACNTSVSNWSTFSEPHLDANLWLPWEPPIAGTARMVELCPATCAAAGFPLEGCDLLAPPAPPAAPTPPALPPTPPLAPGPWGASVVVSVQQLRTTLAAVPPLGAIDIYLPPGVVLDLEGAAIVVGAINATIRSAGDGAVFDATHASSIFDVLPGGWLRLESVMLANARSLSPGGALSIRAATVELYGCALTNSSATFGGAASVTDGRLTVLNSTIESSHASWDGGVILAGGSTVVLSRSSIVKSEARLGGVFAVTGSSITVTDGCSIADSTARAVGGVLFATNLNVVLVNGRSSIVNSFAAAGGVGYLGGTARLTESGASVIFNSSCSVAGGAFFLVGGSSLTMIGSSLINSTSPSSGGAISTRMIATGRLLIRDSLIANSTAVNGGVLDFGWQDYGSSVLERVTIVNSSASRGGFAFLSDGYAGTVSVVDSLITESHASGDGGALFMGSGNCLIGAGSRIADSHAGGYGGALLIYGGRLTLTHAAIEHSSSSFSGGAMYVTGKADATVTGVVISDSNVTSITGAGGAFYVSAGSLTVNGGSRILRSACASGDTGLAHVIGGSLIIANSFLSSIFSSRFLSSGHLLVEGGVVELVNITVPDLQSRLLAVNGGGVVLLTFVEIEQGACVDDRFGSILFQGANARLVLRSISITPLPGCNEPPLFGRALTCGDTYYDPIQEANAGVCAPSTTCTVLQLAGFPELESLHCECEVPASPDPRYVTTAAYRPFDGCLQPTQLVDVAVSFREVSIVLTKPHEMTRELQVTIR